MSWSYFYLPTLLHNWQKKIIKDQSKRNDTWSMIINRLANQNIISIYNKKIKLNNYYDGDNIFISFHLLRKFANKFFNFTIKFELEIFNILSHRSQRVVTLTSNLTRDISYFLDRTQSTQHQSHRAHKSTAHRFQVMSSSNYWGILNIIFFIFQLGWTCVSFDDDKLLENIWR